MNVAAPRRVRLRLPGRPPLRPKFVLIALGVLLTIGVGWLWFRDSSFAKVRDVYVVGLRSDQQDEIRSALTRAGENMTTLHVHEDVLKAAVQRYPSVASLKITAKFPHKLTIEVVERLPLANVGNHQGREPVTAGGTVLTGLDSTKDLPDLNVGPAPAGRHVTDGPTLAGLALLAAAPKDLRDRVKALNLTRKLGFVVDLRNGPDLYFGRADSLAAKWAAAGAVLADAAAQGAHYLDVRVPERTAAGGGGVAPPEPTVTPTPTPVPGATPPPIAPPAATPTPGIATP